MKIFHLSDLHIGKRVNEFSMLDDQKEILDQIIRLADQEKPDAILICGDVYDKSVPSAEAMVLFDNFLCHLAARKLPTLVISGNHDSPERLAFGNRLMEYAGIHISSAYDGQAQKITLTDELGQVDFWLLPFVKPSHVRRFYPDETIETYTDALRVAVEKMGIDKSRRNVLLTHQFVTGASMGGSEELNVGGTDNVDASVFADFDYVALGHIHGQQNIGSSRIRYCGTPMKYSFSEESHHKSVTLLTLGAKDERHIDLLPLVAPHDMRTIRGTFKEITAKAFYEGTATDDYLRIFLTDEDDVHEAMGKLRIIYPNLMELKYDNTRTRSYQNVGQAEKVEEKTPLQLFEELYQKQNNRPMSDEQRRFASELIDSIKEGKV